MPVVVVLHDTLIISTNQHQVEHTQYVPWSVYRTKEPLVLPCSFLLLLTLSISIPPTPIQHPSFLPTASITAIPRKCVSGTLLSYAFGVHLWLINFGRINDKVPFFWPCDLWYVERNALSKIFLAGVGDMKFCSNLQLPPKWGEGDSRGAEQGSPSLVFVTCDVWREML